MDCQFFHTKEYNYNYNYPNHVYYFPISIETEEQKDFLQVLGTSRNPTLHSFI